MPNFMEMFAAAIPFFGRTTQQPQIQQAVDDRPAEPQKEPQKEPEWDAKTGTFAAKEYHFVKIIEFTLAEMGIDNASEAMLNTLGNAAVYLHGADTANRPTPTIQGIADEWASLGVSVQEAINMIDRSIAHHEAGRIEHEGQRELDGMREGWAIEDNDADQERREMEEPQYDPSDYWESYADVAGDATLSWRLENENPIDILASVREEARAKAGLDRGDDEMEL